MFVLRTICGKLIKLFNVSPCDTCQLLMPCLVHYVYYTMQVINPGPITAAVGTGLSCIPFLVPVVSNIAMVFKGFYNDDDYVVASIHFFWRLYGLFICLIKTFAMLSCFLIISSRGFGIAIWPLYQGYGDAIWLSSLFIKLQYFIHYAFMYMGPRMSFDSVLSLGFISSAVFSTDIFLGTYQINTLHFELVV